MESFSRWNMNYASEAFSALIRPITRRSNSRYSITESSRQGETTCTQRAPRQAGDLEEDGFLVVGETSSERTTVYTHSFTGNLDSPPQYNHLQVMLKCKPVVLKDPSASSSESNYCVQSFCQAACNSVMFAYMQYLNFIWILIASFKTLCPQPERGHLPVEIGLSIRLFVHLSVRQSVGNSVPHTKCNI